MPNGKPRLGASTIAQVPCQHASGRDLQRLYACSTAREKKQNKHPRENRHPLLKTRDTGCRWQVSCAQSQFLNNGFSCTASRCQRLFISDSLGVLRSPSLTWLQPAGCPGAPPSKTVCFALFFNPPSWGKSSSSKR